MKSKEDFAHFRLMHTIASGASSKVKLAVNKETGQRVALKVLNLTEKKHYQAEVNALTAVPPHRTVISLLSCATGLICHTRTGTRRCKSYIELELCEHGDLFSHVSRKGPMPERIARWCFVQLIEAVQHLHSYGIAHLDIKPENILVDSCYRIRLCDFGFACKTPNGLANSSKGTRAYRAPETYFLGPYCAAKADIFSLAVTLFVLVVGKPPFVKAEAGDSFYHFIEKGDWRQFWSLHRSTRMPVTSAPFQHLMEQALTRDPALRPDFYGLYSHEWTLIEPASDSEAELWLRM